MLKYELFRRLSFLLFSYVILILRRIKTYKSGKSGAENYTFTLRSGDITAPQRTAIKEEAPTITITYYPITESIVSMQVFFDDGYSFTLPAGSDD